MTVSASDSGTQPSNEDIANLDYRLGHYVSAVGKRLLNEGIPITDFSIEPPTVRKGRWEDGEVWVYFTEQFSYQVGSDDSCSLCWNEVSGWYFEREVHPVGTEKRYLGHGLVPDPERLATFLVAIQVNPDSAGNFERPRYRTSGPPYADLLARLSPYLPQFVEPHQETFARVRAMYFERRIVTAIAVDSPGPLANLPLFPGEFAALELVLEWADGALKHGIDGVLAALAADIRNRRDVGPASIEKFRTNLAVARTRLEYLRSQDQQKRDSDPV